MITMDNKFCDRNGNLIDYYSILNVPYNAGKDEINSAFRTLIKRYHPDTSEESPDNAIELIESLITGHRILSDSNSREEYDNQLFKKIMVNSKKEILPVIPGSRIKYSTSLKRMLKARLLRKKMKRDEILNNIGQDIEILITEEEAQTGAIAFIELPARMHCPICYGRDSQCHVCKGIGRIHTTSKLRVIIPEKSRHGTFLEYDLLKIKNSKLITFRAKNIRIKISHIKKGQAL